MSCGGNNELSKKRAILLTALVVFGVFGSVAIYTVKAQELAAIQLILLDEKGKPLTEISKNAEVQVQIDALVPTGEVYETIFYGVLKKPNSLKFWDSGNVVKIPLSDQKLRSVLSKWEKRYPKGIGASFVISVWVLDYERGKVYRGFTVVNYNTRDIKKGFKKTAKINIHKLPPKPLPEKASSGDVSIQGSNRQFYYWKTDWSFSWRPQDYIRVPVLIVDNKYPASGVVNAWVDIIKEYYTNFGLTVAYGYKISEKDTPSLDIYGNDFYTIHDKFYFSRSLILGPEEKGHIYIYAKPYHLHEKEYYCTASLENCVPTGDERIQEGVNDIETTGDNEIVGGSSNGLPDSEIMNWIYSGTEMRYADSLAVSDSKSLALLISDASGSCSADFGIGIPIGALAVALSGGAVPPWAAGLSAGIYYTSPSFLNIYGGIQNYGEWGNVDQDVSEYIYVGVSDYTYHVGTCDTQVPIGIYIESR
ncbi:hypothetical protein ADU37_CDS10570 [Thermococcus sp. 2319x1]|uniref:hypothetical protein n=1 Tax=Thermococcus sp. 2319x1 TaxID=1674923 RepID=UPI00073A6398|nr:hypothetical protein [Thermococcus sp. 2319x1]ALV62756.1 hypothetical protein ADU37_CDS10570 [Thermococcus sp. 2319x1]